MADNMLPCLIADSAAFLKNAPLQQMANKIFTIQDVISEIRDATTRHRLAVLPYTIEFREPSTESVKIVSDFAKKTGDFPSLSAVDIRVMALVYQLEKEFCSSEHIRNEPVHKIEHIRGNGDVKSGPPLGFFYGGNQNHKKEEGSEDHKEKIGTKCDAEMEEEKGMGTDKTTEECKAQTNIGNQYGNGRAELENCEEIGDREAENEEENEGIDTENGDENGDENDEDDDDDDDDDGGWITPGNISKVKKEMGLENVQQTTIDVKSACLTTDFAMQNVLMQMGLHVISIDGMLINQARSYILKCYGCAKETTQMERQFCQNCGNKTLTKVSVTINTDGSLKYHYSRRRRPINIRGTKYSIPLPKAGRQANNVILSEDQKKATQRLPKSRDSANPLDPDFIARSSPFTYKDVTSKAFTKGFHLKQNSHKNPNEGRKTKSKRK